MKRILLPLLILVGLATAWWFWWRPVNRELTERPPRSSSSAPVSPTESTIQVSAVIPYTAIGEAVTKQMPATINDQGRQNVCVDLNETVQKTVEQAIGGDVGKLIGGVARIVTTVVTVNQVRHVCQDVDYRISIERTGPASATLAPSGSAVRVSVPISVSGEVGFSGDVAKALALDRKSFRGSILAFADVSANLGSNWCPTVQVNPDFVWLDKAQLEIAGKVWINIDGTAGPKLKDALGDAARKIPEAINCGQFKAAVSPLWHNYSWPINNGKDVLAYVNLIPKSVGFSGLSYQPDSIRTAIALGTITEVTTAAPTRPSADPGLPEIDRIPATSDRISLNIPLRAGYDELQAAVLNEMGNKDFSAQTPAGLAHVRISEVTIYPADKRIVVGLHFSAHAEKRIANVSGWVFLAAEPSLDASAQTLKLKNVTFTRDLDNALWSVLSAVFKGPIQNALEQEGVLDLKQPIRALRVQVKNNLAAASSKQGVTVAIDDTFLGLKQINLTDKTIEVIVGLDGTADVAVARQIELQK